MGAGYLQTGYYFGFFVAAALNYSTVGAAFRLAGDVPVRPVPRWSCLARSSWASVKETAKLASASTTRCGAPREPAQPEIFSPALSGAQTLVMSVLLTVAIIGLVGRRGV